MQVNKQWCEYLPNTTFVARWGQNHGHKRHGTHKTVQPKARPIWSTVRTIVFLAFPIWIESLQTFTEEAHCQGTERSLTVKELMSVQTVAGKFLFFRLLFTYLKVIFFVWLSWLPFITGHLATKEKKTLTMSTWVYASSPQLPPQYMKAKKDFKVPYSNCWEWKKNHIVLFSLRKGEREVIVTSVAFFLTLNGFV